ncbi:uncharacterized protein METZ01_LOCUS328433, partial [marine metagenome]
SGFTLKESIVSDNFSNGGGGGILVWGAGADPVVEDCIVTGNTTGNNGGGIMINGTDNAIITRTSVVDNHAANNVGGIYVLVTSTTFNNITISGNTSGGGGAIGILEGGHVELTNSIVWDNPGQGNFMSDGTGSLNITYSDIEGGFDGEGNIDADPLFTDADNGDFTLQSGSLCIDAGTADLDGDGVEDITDYFGLAPDMGAYEFLVAATGLQYFIQGSSVYLAWDPFADVQYYRLERSTDPLFATDVVTQYLTDNYYTDSNLEWNTEYFYRVSAFIGYWTDYSNVVSVILEYVDVSPDADIPLSYKIHQNYPNPFNPVTSIRYDLPEDAMVNVIVYDMMG